MWDAKGQAGESTKVLTFKREYPTVAGIKRAHNRGRGKGFGATQAWVQLLTLPPVELCASRELTSLLWASVSSSVKWGYWYPCYRFFATRDYTTCSEKQRL